MTEILETEVFSDWLDGLRDRNARAQVEKRITRLAYGHPGDVVPVGEGVSEMRIHYGPGYRVYFTRHGDELIILLAGGDKGSQRDDINLALTLAREIKEQ